MCYLWSLLNDLGGWWWPRLVLSYPDITSHELLSYASVVSAAVLSHEDHLAATSHICPPKDYCSPRRYTIINSVPAVQAPEPESINQNNVKLPLGDVLTGSTQLCLGTLKRLWCVVTNLRLSTTIMTTTTMMLLAHRYTVTTTIISLACCYTANRKTTHSSLLGIQ